MIDVQFKSENGRREQAELEREFWLIDPRGRAYIFWLSSETKRHFGKPVVVTELLRTAKENHEQKGSPYSAHLFGKGRAWDIRSFIYTPDEIQQIRMWTTSTWGEMIYLKVHDAGSGNHIHGNIVWKYEQRPYPMEDV